MPRPTFCPHSALSVGCKHALAVVVLTTACGRIEFAVRSDAAIDADARCPQGYVLIAGNAALGTTDFCAMQFEARALALATGTIVADGCDVACAPGMHVAASTFEGLPWHNITATDAQASCRRFGPGYDLMANREWMTIARDAELVGSNWYGGAPGAGRLVEGRTDSSNAGVISDTSDPYGGTDNSSADPPGAGWEQRRTLDLSSGAVVWDMPGNYQEWIDWTLGGPVDGAPTPCTGNELNLFACAGIANDDFNSAAGVYDRTHGAGFVIGGSGNATRRGGQAPDLAMGIAGIYALNMNRNVSDVFGGTTFRCVLRL